MHVCNQALYCVVKAFFYIVVSVTSVGRHSKVLWEMWDEFCTFKALSFFLFWCVVYSKIRSHIILGQIILICQDFFGGSDGKTSASFVSSVKPLIMLPTRRNGNILWNQTVNQLLYLWQQNCLMGSKLCGRNACYKEA